MPTVSADIRIAAPCERVFDVLLDTANYAEWLTLHEGWPAGEPEITPGASFAEEVKVIGKTTQIVWTAEEVTAPSTLALEGRGPMRLELRCRYSLRDEGGGTRVQYAGSFEGGPLPLSGRLGSVVARKARAAVDESLAGLKGFAEAGAPDRAARRRPRRRVGALGILGMRRDRPRVLGAAPPSRARLAAAIEDNTIAVRALTDEVARMNEQVARVAWLGGPLDLLRRGTGPKGSESEDQGHAH